MSVRGVRPASVDSNITCRLVSGCDVSQIGETEGAAISGKTGFDKNTVVDSRLPPLAHVFGANKLTGSFPARLSESDRLCLYLTISALFWSFNYTSVLLPGGV